MYLHSLIFGQDTAILQNISFSTSFHYSFKYKVRGVMARNPSKEEHKDDAAQQYTPKRR